MYRAQQSTLPQLLITALFTILGMQAAGAALLFRDNFEAEPVSDYVQGYTGFTNWNVTKGTVDILTAPPHLNWHAPITGEWSNATDGLIVDMGGFSAGRIETKSSLSLAAGRYRLSFFASGNLRVAEDDILRVSVGNIYTTEFTFASTNPKQLITIDFTVATPVLANLAFEQVNNNGAVGAHLDDVALSSIPEPTALMTWSVVVLSLSFARRPGRYLLGL